MSDRRPIDQVSEMVRGEHARTEQISDVESERILLGLILWDVSKLAEIRLRLDAKDFYHPAHALMFEVICELADAGTMIDAPALAAELKRRDRLQSCGGVQYLFELFEHYGAFSPDEHVATVARWAHIRRLIDAGQKIAHLWSLAALSSEELSARALELVGKATQIRGPSRHKTGIDLGIRLMERVHAAATNPGKISGRTTGLRDLDACLGGLQPSQLIVIGARPSVGKSALLRRMLRAITEGRKERAFFASLEMSSAMSHESMACELAGVDSARLRRGLITRVEFDQLREAVERIAALPIVWCDDVYDVFALTSEVLREHQREPLGAVFVDFVQRLTGPWRDAEQTVMESTYALQRLAKAIERPVVAASQINRAPEQTLDRRPELKDLRGSGGVEMGADVAILMYRDEVYNRDPSNPERGICELDVAKQRMGPLDRIPVHFCRELTSFGDLDEKAIATWRERRGAEHARKRKATGKPNGGETRPPAPFDPEDLPPD